MITTVAAKLWFAVFGLAIAAIVLYAAFSDAEWFGLMVLGTIAVAALGLGALGVAIRDGNVAADATPPAAVRRTGAAPWPALLAVGGALAIVGLAGGNALLYLGLGIVVAALVEWMIQGWAERATEDPVYNLGLRHRIMSPLEIPILSAIIVGVVMISLSRVLLAVSKTGSIVVGGAIAVAILLVASLLVSRPQIGSSVFATVLAVAAVALIGAGIAGGIAGEREIESHHGESTEHGEAGAEEEGNNPAADEGGEDQSDPGADPSGAETDGESTPNSDDTDTTSPEADANSTPASTVP